MKKNEILKVYGPDYKNMTKQLLETANLIDEIQDKNCKVGIKPNLVAPTPAFLGATTHPEIVEGIIEYLKEHQVEDITIMEGSWVGDTTQDSFDVCGYFDLANRTGVKLVDLQKDSHHTESIEGLDLEICDTIRSIDFFINVPVVKGHCQTKITCALKNMKGLLPNTEKRHFHSMGLHMPICYLNRLVKQDFIVVDHICGDLDFEDGGNPVEKNCIMAAKNPVVVDNYVCKLLGYDTKDVEYVDMSIRMLEEKNLIGDTKVWKLEGNDLVEDDEAILDIHRKVVDIQDMVNEVDSCSACYGTLIPALDELREGGLLKDFVETIHIGQGYRGKRGKIGVGNCTRNFDFSVPGCPPSKEEIIEALRKYIGK